MKNFLILTGLVVAAVFVPFGVIVGIWAGVLPESLQPMISTIGVAMAVIYIVGGNLYLMYGDIKTGRYSK